MNRLRGRISHLVAQATTADGPNINDLLTILEGMLEATVRRRIALLIYRDLETVYDYLVQVFGLGPGNLTRDDDGRIIQGELQAGDGVVWLHPELARMGRSSPAAAGVSIACMAVMVEDVDAHFRHAAEEGVSIEYEPVDQPYGYREYGARDIEGHLWSFMKTLD